MNTSMNWFAVTVRSGPLGVPGNSIYNIQNKIINEPFFGIYKIKILGEGTVTPELLLYAKCSEKDPNKLDEKVEQFLRGNMVGAASYRVIRGEIPESDADINVPELNSFKAIVAGKEFSPIGKKTIKDSIRNENIRLAEVATVHIKSISFDDQEELYLIVNIGYSNGLIKQDKYDSLAGKEAISFRNQASPIEKEMGLSINNIDLISTPIVEERKIPLPDGFYYLDQEKLLEYKDIIENKAKNIAKELWEQQRHVESFYKKFVHDDIIKKYSILEDVSPQQIKNQDNQALPIDVTVHKDQDEAAEKKKIEIPKYKIVDYGINFGKEGNIKLHLAVQVEGVTEEPEVAIIDLGSEELKKPELERKPQTLEKLIKPEGFAYIANELDTVIDDYINIVSKDTVWKGDIIDKIKFPVKDRALSKDWNARYYFYLRKINTEAL